MAFIVIKSTPLSAESKKRLGDRILHALLEGIKPGETVIRYEPEDSSVYMDGTLVEGHSPVTRAAVEFANTAVDTAKRVSDHWKAKKRRSAHELAELKTNLVKLLRSDKSLSSFEAQAKLGLKDCDWAPNTLRRMFHELTESKEIRVEGQKRGTRYHWIVEDDLPEPKLEKA